MTYPDSILGVPMGPWDPHRARRGHVHGVSITHGIRANGSGYLTHLLTVEWDAGWSIDVAGATFDEALSALRRELVRIGHRRYRPHTEDV